MVSYFEELLMVPGSFYEAEQGNKPLVGTTATATAPSSATTALSPLVAAKLVLLNALAVTQSLLIPLLRIMLPRYKQLIDCMLVLCYTSQST